MGNAANFEGGTLYALQSVLTICGVFEKNKDEALSANLTTRPHANINYKSIKSVLGGGMMHSIAVGEMS